MKLFSGDRVIDAGFGPRGSRQRFKRIGAGGEEPCPGRDDTSSAAAH